MAGTHSRQMFEAASERALVWRARGYLLMLFLALCPWMLPVVSAMVEACRDHEAGEMEVKGQRTLRVTKARGRAWDLECAQGRWETDANLEETFRFDMGGLRALEEGLGIPDVVRLGDQEGSWYTEVTKTEVLLITLERLHCCTTYQKLAVNYGLQRSTICNVVNYGLAFLDDGYREPLRDIRRWVHFVPQWCETAERKTEGTPPPCF